MYIRMRLLPLRRWQLHEGEGEEVHRARRQEHQGHRDARREEGEEHLRLDMVQRRALHTDVHVDVDVDVDVGMPVLERHMLDTDMHQVWVPHVPRPCSVSLWVVA